MSKMSQLYGDVSEMLEQGVRFESIASELIQSYGLTAASAAQFIREVEVQIGLDDGYDGQPDDALDEAIRSGSYELF